MTIDIRHNLSEHCNRHMNLSYNYTELWSYGYIKKIMVVGMSRTFRCYEHWTNMYRTEHQRMPPLKFPMQWHYKYKAKCEYRVSVNEEQNFPISSLKSGVRNYWDNFTKMVSQIDIALIRKPCIVRRYRQWGYLVIACWYFKCLYSK